MYHFVMCEVTYDAYLKNIDHFISLNQLKLEHIHLSTKMIQVAYLHIMLQQMMITTQSQHNYMYAKLQQAIIIFSQNLLITTYRKHI